VRLNRDLEARVHQEVEARTAVQNRLAQAQKMQALGQLAGGIAHDFNNILQAVSGAAAVIDRRAEDTERVRRFARAAMDAAERGASITGRLLAFSRQSELRAEPQDVAAVLASIREVLAHTLGTPIEVHASTEPDLPPLLADRGQLETALVNLATNARDAMPEGGRIILAASAETVAVSGCHPAGLVAGVYIRLSLSDSGGGMDEATMARASEPFFTTKPPGVGTGLGLAMVRGFAEQSRGGMSIASTPGLGTTVTVWLPAGHASADVQHQADGTMTAKSRRGSASLQQVLLVDDDELVRETVRAQLEDYGYVVLTASSGQEALALLDADVPVDVLVSDLSMPGINGLTTIREAHRRRPGLPAVLLTGYSGERAALAAEDGSFLLLRKPAGGSMLISRIEAALTKKDAA
jgi:nitrogen-specific signal transduction histidine kinase/ActR/RegA family two-component response regulator